jgi:LPXTG-site transpeptidase (sortase) family protein
MSLKRWALLIGSALLIITGLTLAIVMTMQFFGVGPQIEIGGRRTAEVTADPAVLQSSLPMPTWARASLPPAQTQLPPANAALPTTPPEPMMFIPSLDVEAPIVTLKRGEDEVWEVDELGALMGHLEGTSPPGEGNSVYAGHLTLSNQAPGPLADLDKIKTGAIIRVFDGARMYTYEVVKLRTVDWDDLSIIKETGQPTLTLITCGRWSWWENQYRTRVVATARLVE